MTPDLEPPPTYAELVELLNKLSNEELEEVANLCHRLIEDLETDNDQS